MCSSDPDVVTECVCVGELNAMSVCVCISRLLIQLKEEIIFSKTNSCKNYGFTNCLMLKIVETFQLWATLYSSHVFGRKYFQFLRIFV